MNNISNKKKQLRIKLFKIRKEINTVTSNHLNKNILKNLFKTLNFNRIKIVSSFISIYSEINTDELNNYIVENNKLLCFPSIWKKNKHLIFKKYNKGEKFIKGEMNIMEPPKENEILIPELLFVPCLAFDSDGFRLGYGGGYYDKTFDFLNKNKKKFISVGYAFDDQKISKVPRDIFDIKLNYVMTEKNLYSFL